MVQSAYTRNVGSRTRSSQIQKLAWNKLKGKSLQLAFMLGKAVKDVYFLVLLNIYIYIIYIYIIYIYIYIYIFRYIYINRERVYIYIIYIYDVQHTQYVQGFDWVFGVAPIGRKALLLEIVSGTQYTYFAASYSLRSARFLVLYLLCLLCLLCLAHLRASEYVGGSRISFEACGISF